MNKPDVKTAWAIGEAAKKVEPLLSQRQSGWVYEEAPSASVFNHWMNAVHQWQQYLEANDDESDLRIDALIAVLENHAEQLKRLEEWLERIQTYIESHPISSQPPPPKPPPSTPAPTMPSYVWDKIQRNQGEKHDDDNS